MCKLRGNIPCFHDCLIQRNAAISVKAPALSQDTHPTKTQHKKKTTKNNANYLAMKPAFITMFRAGTEGRPKIKEGKVKRKSETNRSMGIVGDRWGVGSCLRIESVMMKFAQKKVKKNQ